MGAELDLIVAAVTGALAGGVAAPLTAPADALADFWKGKILARLNRVHRSVERRRGEDGTVVNERVAYKVLSEAAFTDDRVVSEYLAGVITGSRDGSDDGVPVLAEIGRLSTFQLRLHYILYRAAAKANIGPGARVFLPMRELAASLDAPGDPALGDRLMEAFTWLEREGLLPPSNGDGWGNDDAFRLVGDADFIVTHTGGERGEAHHHLPGQAGLLFTTAHHGAQLLKWACGLPDENIAGLAPDELLDLSPAVPRCDALPIEEFATISYEERRSRFRTPG